MNSTNKFNLTLFNKTIIDEKPWIAIRGFKSDLMNSGLMAGEWVKWALEHHAPIKIEARMDSMENGFDELIRH